MKVTASAIFLITASALCISCNQSENKTHIQTMDTKDSSNTSIQINQDSVTYQIDGQNYVGYIMYPENLKEKRPGVLVVPEWWGLNDYTLNCAKKIAQLGYISMAVDMYGDGKQAPDPATAQQFATPYYKDPTLARPRLEAALRQLKNSPHTDTSRIGAIGYCFGGFIVLNAAKLGADLKAVVSFHGGLTGVKPDKNLLKAKILVCHGAHDEFENPHVAEFKKQMDSIGADYTFKIYPNATHAFTNPAATENGKKFNMPIKYNAAADAASWNDMKEFFKKYL